MPSGDRTGPMGMGPLTGGGRGPCGAGFGRGARRWAGPMGYVRGRGFGGVMPIAPVVSDAAMLKQEAEMLKARLAAVEKELNNSKDGNAQ